MGTAISNGIRISVFPRYLSEESRPAEERFLFTYRIEIENVGDRTIQLMSRHWYILDSFCHSREVAGDGVIGQQPILKPGQIHRYTSWCPLESDIGLMFGFYKMRNLESQEEFEVRIPEFTLCSSAKLN